MSLSRFLLLSVLSLSAGMSANAADVTVGLPTYSGAGCPANSADAVLVPDGTALTVGFSSFTLEALPRKIKSTHCKLNIPIQVASGVRVMITETDFEGFLQLPKRAGADLHSKFKLMQGSRRIGSDAVCYVKGGEFNGSFSKSHAHRFNLRTGCGGTYNLEIDTQIGIANLSKTEAASMTVDAINLGTSNGAMSLHLSYSSCR